MATKNPTQNVTGPHMEAPEHGGATYHKCEACGRESVNGPKNILHTEDCPERNHK